MTTIETYAVSSLRITVGTHTRFRRRYRYIVRVEFFGCFAYVPGRGFCAISRAVPAKFEVRT